MNDQSLAALRSAIENDESLQQRFSEATTEAEVVALAAEAGIVLEAADVGEAVDVSDAELERVSGGYTFPQTDWIYCDNPWTNYWCTLKC